MYQSLEASLHDAFWNAHGPSAELPLLRRFLRNHPGRSLEVGCGSGRLLLPLLAEGFSIEGLEPSGEMLAILKEQATQQNLNPIILTGELKDFRKQEEIQKGQPLEAIVIPAFTLQLFDDPIKGVADCRKLLPKGGGLYLTVFFPLAEVYEELPAGEDYLDEELMLPDGSRARMYTSHSLDKTQQILTRNHRYELVKGTEISKHQSRQVLRYCSEEDWRHLLHATGFEIVETFTDFEENPTPLDVDDSTAGVTTFLTRAL